MHKAALMALLIVFAFVSCCALTGCSFEDRTWETAEIKAIGDINTVPPDITAKAASMYSLELDKFVYLKNENKKIDPYSITKVLTCYLALENLDPDKVVTASAKSTRAYENGTTIYLKTGEKISILDLCYGAMLESGNDAAYALGEAVAGSEAGFAKLMNETVKEWGCNDTHFVNANGWKNDDHYTTAHDMGIIAKNCFANETLVKIAGTKKYTIPATNMTEAREMSNHFISMTKSAKGVKYGKTGTWDTDDCSIVVGFTKDCLNEIIVLLRDTKKGRKADVVKLIDFSDKVTPGFLVSDKGDLVTVQKVRHGEITKVGLAVDGRTLAYPASNSTDDIKIEIKADDLEAPLTKGDKAGTYTVYSDGKLIGEHSLVVSEDVKTGWLPSYLYISNQQTKVIGTWLAGILVLICLLIYLRKRHVRKVAERHRGKHDIR